jgi:hypothetical protein
VMVVTPKALMVTSTSTTVIQDMNARALSQMEQGRNQDAVQVLRQAVRDLGMWMPGSQQVITTHSSGCARPWHGSVKDAREASAITTISLVTLSPFSSTLLGQGSSNISSYMIHQHSVALPQLCHGRDIYNRAFHLPLSDEAISSEEHRTQATAIILCNMALASHRHGIQSGKSQPLAHAAFAYIAVLDMLGPTAIDLFPEIAVLLLVIIGNLAHIHLELRQMPEFMSARSCLRELMCNIRLDQMSTQDFGFFNMQLFCFDREATWYSPAA